MDPGTDQEFRLPDLRFVPAECLMPHERSDPRRVEPLIRRIREQAVLKNPPVVSPLEGGGASGRFVVLDGANRVTAARAAGLPHMVVQVVRYEPPAVELRTWYHALAGLDRDEIAKACRTIAGLECRAESELHARALIARRDALAYAAFPDGTVTAFTGGRDLQEHNQLLNAIVDLYRDHHGFYRMSTDSLPLARSRYPEVTALLVFPHFEPAEVMELATGGELMPAGITRHLIRWRALRVNIAIDQLADTRHGLEEKNRWLREWLQERLAMRQVRFYEESTVLFDE